MSESVAERMARFAQNHQGDIATFIGCGIDEVSILAAQSRDPGYESCPACILLDRTHWPIEKCPDLPYSECTQPLGCRCVSLAIVPL